MPSPGAQASPARSSGQVTVTTKITPTAGGRLHGRRGPRSSLCRSPPAEHPLGRASARYRAALGPEQRDRSCTGKRWVTPRGFQRRRAVARVISPNTRAVKLTMANAAILVGNIEYQRLSKLECCHDDLLAIKQLLEATEKYEEITIIENAEADPLKSQLRAAVDKVQSPEELLFYFTGHR